MHARPGFTLIELMVTMALAGLLLAIGTPWLSSLINSSRVTAEVNRFIRAVHIARSQVAMASGEVVICPSKNGSQCAREPDAWGAGWLAFFNVDRDSPPVVDRGERILLSHDFDDTVRVRSNRQAFVFRSYAKRSTNGTVVFCDWRSDSARRAVVVSYTGRPRSAHRRTTGEPYACED